MSTPVQSSRALPRAWKGTDSRGVEGSVVCPLANGEMAEIVEKPPVLGHFCRFFTSIRVGGVGRGLWRQQRAVDMMGQFQYTDAGCSERVPAMTGTLSEVGGWLWRSSG